MLAANPPERVTGRITLLTASMSTIQGIDGGALNGTKRNKKLIFFNVENSIHPG